MDDNKRFVAVYELVQDVASAYDMGLRSTSVGRSVAIIVASGYESVPTFYFHFSL